MLFGIPGNLSIIIIILKNKLLRKQPNNLFLLNMALTDLLNLTLNTILFYFKQDEIFTNYYLGILLCKLTPVALSKFLLFKTYLCYIIYFLVFNFVCGALSLTALTITRVLGIVFPKVADFLTFHKWVVKLIILFIYLVSICSTFPSIGYEWRKIWVSLKT